MLIYYMRKYYYIIIILLVLPLKSAWSYNHNQTIKILIGKYDKSFLVYGNGITLSTVDNKITSAYSINKKSLAIYKKKNGIKINRDYIKGKRFFLTSSDNTLLVNGMPYSGRIILDSEQGNYLFLINEIDIEYYLEGLISTELSPIWEMTAMKAQAVIARTYALYQKSQNSNNPYHLTSTVLHQVYKGIEYGNSKTRQAVKETAGEVITYNGAPIIAAYHSCCGGRTEAALDVWSNGALYLKTVFCGACTPYTNYFWKVSVPFGALHRHLCQTDYTDCGEIKDINITRRTRNNRVQEVEIVGDDGTITLRGNDLRSVLGFTDMRSTNFIIKKSLEHDVVEFLGIGNGHGVGLCQWGARTRAQRGESYKNILLHYYPGTKIEKLY